MCSNEVGSGNGHWGGFMATYTVTTASDAGADATATGNLAAETADGGGLSLREAIILANATAGADDVVFAQGAGEAFESAATIFLTNDLSLTSDLTITGPTAELTLNGGYVHTPLVLSSSADVTAENLTITNGYGSVGGGIYIQTLAALTLNNAVLRDNVASTGGGAIGNNGTLTVNNSTFEDNEGGIGGAIASSFSAYISESAFISNEATQNAGGAIYNTGSLELSQSGLLQNTAADFGGGLANFGLASTYETTFYKNTTDYTNASGGGGAIAGDGTLAMVNTTIFDNASRGTGGVDVDGSLFLYNSLVLGNNRVLAFGWRRVFSHNEQSVCGKRGVLCEFLQPNLRGRRDRF